MTHISPIGIPADVCVCGHWRHDHDQHCIVTEDGLDCICTCFRPDEKDEGYLFTDDEGRKVEGFLV